MREDLDSHLIKSQCLDVLEQVNVNAPQTISLLYISRVFQRTKSVTTSLNFEALSCIFAKLPPGILGCVCLFLQSIWYVLVRFNKPKYKNALYVCRSYNATLFIYFIARFTGSKYIIDTRSPFIKEKLISGSFSEGSLLHKFWGRLYKKLNHSAYKVICISNSHRDSMAAAFDDSEKFYVVYNSLPQSFLPQSIFNQSDLSSPTLKLCYLGSLGHWNSYKNYQQFLIDLQQNSIPFSVTFITSRVHHESIYSAFDNFDVCCIEVKQHEIQHILNSFDFGLYFLPYTDERVGVKSVEYLSSGLPIIHNGNILGLHEFSQTFDNGFYHKDNIINREFELNIVRNVHHKQQLSKIAYGLFNRQAIAEIYKKILWR